MKKLVSEGTWPLTLNASVKGRSTAQQRQDVSMTVMFTLKHLRMQFIFHSFNVIELQYGTEYGVFK